MTYNSNSILEWRSNEKGQLIAFEDSRPLNDLRNPMDEALLWARSVQATRLILVGIGSGFHLEALKHVRPQCEVIVIDCRSSLVGFLQKKYPDVDMVIVEDLKSLMAHSRVREFMNSGFEVQALVSTFGAQNRFFREVVHFLNLRTAESLDFFFNTQTGISTEILLNAKQFLKSVPIEKIPFRKSEILTIGELIK